MTTPRVKICGVTRPADVDTAVAAGADAVGFVVDVPVDTPREISAETAASLAARVPPFVATVLVTMAEDPDTVAALATLVGVDAVQVHGDLTTRLGPLTAAVDVPVIAAVDATTATVETQRDTPAAALLLDSTDDTGAGGTGDAHDWATTATLVDALDVPVIVAGGLTPDNVADAVTTVDPYAVDVATGVEATGGEKDPDAVHAFVEHATTTDVKP